MEAFRGLSDSAKADLVRLLPSVDRRGPTRGLSRNFVSEMLDV